MRPARVVLDDDRAEGLAVMLHGLLSAAAGRPAKQALLDGMRGTVTIRVPDAGVAVGLRFAGGTATVYDHALAGSTVTLTLPSDVLLGLPTVPLLLGLPSPLVPEGRAFARRLLRGEVRVGGLRHLGLVTGLNRLLSLA
jgi:hypothetical protein